MPFDDNKIKMARKPGEGTEGKSGRKCTGEGKRWKGNIREGSTAQGSENGDRLGVECGGEVSLVRLEIREGYREGKTGTGSLWG